MKKNIFIFYNLNLLRIIYLIFKIFFKLKLILYIINIYITFI